MSKGGRFATVLVVGLGASMACASRSESGGQRPNAGSSPAAVRIDNQTWSDVRAYLGRGASRSLLGFVTAGKTDVFPVPTDFLAGSADLTLIAEPVGSVQAFTSEAFVIDPGAIVEWTIRNQPAHSTLTVR